MKNIQQQLSILTQSILTGSALMLGAAIAQAQPTGSITFSPFSAAKVPVLGSTMLILLALLLAFIAFVSFRKQQNGIIPVMAGALALASLASAGGGISLLHKAYAGGGGIVIIDPAGETKTIVGNAFNSYFNDSGVTLKIGPVSLPPPGDCPVDALAAANACANGLELADGAQCDINCVIIIASAARIKTDIAQIGTIESGLPWYQFRYINDASLYEGEIAQDVLTQPQTARQTMSSDYMGGEYAMLGLSMGAAN